MSPDITDKIKAIFCEAFPSLEADAFDFNQQQADFEDWDSLAHMQLVAEVETAFDVTFELTEVVDLASPADFVNLVKKKLKA
jgi:acyl carrier protein